MTDHPQGDARPDAAAKPPTPGGPLAEPTTQRGKDAANEEGEEA
jgi:hypothetical protein